MLEQLAAARVAVYPSQHTWIGRRVDYPFNFWYDIEITSTAHVSMKEVESRRLEWHAILVAASAQKVVDTPELDPGIKLLDVSCQNASSKTANPGNEYFHSTKLAACTHGERDSVQAGV